MEELGTTTLGTSSFTNPEGTLGQSWLVDGREIEPRDGLTASAGRLSLSFLVSASAISYWRSELTVAGDVNQESGSGGQFRTVDRAGRASPSTITPPGTQSPPFVPAEYYIAGYGDEPVGGGHFVVSLNGRRVENRDREFSFTTGELATGSAFALSTTFDDLTFGVDQLLAAGVSGTTDGAQRELSLLVSDRQAGALMDALAYPNAVVERDVPDGENFTIDTSDPGRQTIAVTGLVGEGVPADDYLVSDLSVSIAGNAESTRQRWRVDLTAERVTIPDIPARFVPEVEANPNTVTTGVAPETVEFTITITNSGTVGDTQIVVTTVTDSDGTEVFRETIEQTLPANRLIVKEQTWDSSPDPVGEYTVTVSTVDGTATDPITLQEPTQNYQIDNLALPRTETDPGVTVPAKIQRGDSFTVDATITNTGDKSGVDIPITRRYAPAGDGSVVEEDIPLSLSVGETQTQSREISTSAGQDISKNNQITVNTGDDTASDTIQIVDTSFYGFESGDTSRWTGSNLLSVVNNNTNAPETFGAFSGESVASSTTNTLATLNPYNVVGGKKNVDTIEFASQNRSSDNGHGAGVQVLNSNGNVEVGAATFCDQNTTSDRFFAQVAGGITEFDTDDINFGGPTGEGGRAIFKFEFYFDEPAKYVSVQVKWGGPPTEYASLLSYENMIQGTDVETLVLRPFNPTDGFGGTTTVNMKWDEFLIQLQ